MDVSLPMNKGIAAAADRATAVEIPQLSRRGIFAVWAAATLPMAILAWIVAPFLADRFDGAGNVPMAKALILSLAVGLIWQFVLVLALVRREQGTLRWSVVREALWLRAPRSPKSGRRGGRLWLILIPLVVLLWAEELLPAFPHAENRDMGKFLGTDAGQGFLEGNWLWFAIILVQVAFNTALGEELLFRGYLLPRMNRVFGRGDWLANGALFAAYHVHAPWTFFGHFADAFILAYPTKRFRSAWVGIIVHSAQSVFIAAIVLSFVL